MLVKHIFDQLSSPMATYTIPRNGSLSVFMSLVCRGYPRLVKKVCCTAAGKTQRNFAQELYKSDHCLTGPIPWPISTGQQSFVMSQREMEFREEQGAFPSATWERGKNLR